MTPMKSTSLAITVGLLALKPGSASGHDRHYSEDLDTRSRQVTDHAAWANSIWNEERTKSNLRGNGPLHLGLSTRGLASDAQCDRLPDENECIGSIDELLATLSRKREEHALALRVCGSELFGEILIVPAANTICPHPESQAPDLQPPLPSSTERKKVIDAEETTEEEPQSGLPEDEPQQISSSDVAEVSEPSSDELTAGNSDVDGVEPSIQTSSLDLVANETSLPSLGETPSLQRSPETTPTPLPADGATNVIASGSSSETKSTLPVSTIPNGHSISETATPTKAPSKSPTAMPTAGPTAGPTAVPSKVPTSSPTAKPPSTEPTQSPIFEPPSEQMDRGGSKAYVCNCVNSYYALRRAIDEAINDDTIVLCPGTIQFYSHMGCETCGSPIRLQGKRLSVTCGGKPGDCILDGGSDKSSDDAAFHSFIISGSSVMTFDGITWKNFVADGQGPLQNVGGAIVATAEPDSGGSLNFNGCRFEDNKATNGGAVYVVNWSSSFSGCTFLRNQALPGSDKGGGAIYIAGGESTFFDCTFQENHSELTGGAIVFNGDALQQPSKHTVRNSKFTKNTCQQTGGALHASFAGSVTIKSNEFSGNLALDGLRSQRLTSAGAGSFINKDDTQTVCVTDNRVSGDPPKVECIGFFFTSLGCTSVEEFVCA